jgi:hypothetical protein
MQMGSNPVDDFRPKITGTDFSSSSTLICPYYPRHLVLHPDCHTARTAHTPSFLMGAFGRPHELQSDLAWCKLVCSDFGSLAGLMQKWLASLHPRKRPERSFLAVQARATGWPHRRSSASSPTASSLCTTSQRWRLLQGCVLRPPLPRIDISGRQVPLLPHPIDGHRAGTARLDTALSGTVAQSSCAR